MFTKVASEIERIGAKDPIENARRLLISIAENAYSGDKDTKQLFLKSNEDVVGILEHLKHIGLESNSGGILVLGGTGNVLAEQLYLKPSKTFLVDISASRIDYELELSPMSAFTLLHDDIFRTIANKHISFDQDFDGLIYLSNVLDWKLIKLGYSDGLTQPQKMANELIISIIQDILTIFPKAKLVITTVYQDLHELLSIQFSKGDYRNNAFSSDLKEVQVKNAVIIYMDIG